MIDRKKTRKEKVSEGTNKRSESRNLSFWELRDLQKNDGSEE